MKLVYTFDHFFPPFKEITNSRKITIIEILQIVLDNCKKKNTYFYNTIL